MDKNSIVYYRHTNSKLFETIIKTSKELQTNLFECQNFDMLINTINILKPTCVIFDDNSIDDSVFSNFVKSNQNLFIIAMGPYQIKQENLFYCQNEVQLEQILFEVFNRQEKHSDKVANISECYEFITDQMELLNFSIKHLGCLYIKEIVLLLYQSPSLMHYNLKNFYPYISSKFACNICSIERDIRFAIKKAFAKTQTLGMPMKFKTIPTVKQTINYLLDKFLMFRLQQR